MNWVHEALLDFGRQLGLTAFGFGPRGVARLDFATGGMLGIEPAHAGGDVLVYVGRPVGFQPASVLRAALTRAHWPEAELLPLQIAMRGTGADASLLALVRIPGREFTHQSLARVVDTLLNWCDEVCHA
jgi:type III secretion system chaperone SycN